MDKSKKGFLYGWQWAVGFFFFLMFYIFMIGMTDLVKVEFYAPASDTIRAMTLEQVGNDTGSIYVVKQTEIHEQLDNVTMDWNFILILFTGYAIAMSIWSSMQEPKQSIFSLLFGTIGGLIFFVYIFHLVVIGIIDYFNVQFIGQIFGDLINTYVPFYNIIFNNWGIFVIVWIVAMSGFNFLFGKENEENDLF